jgi:hypothetical protein
LIVVLCGDLISKIFQIFPGFGSVCRQLLFGHHELNSDAYGVQGADDP